MSVPVTDAIGPMAAVVLSFDNLQTYQNASSSCEVRRDQALQP
eukprot:COSAG02_NODE_57764_length_279_cov_1.116667_1_plen_42_part_01